MRRNGSSGNGGSTVTNPIDKAATWIVMADSDISEAEALKERLLPFGYGIDLVQDPAKISERVEELGAGYVLVRLRHGQDGRALYRATARLGEARPDTQILYLSDSVSLEARVQAVRGGSAAFVPAPFSAFDIVDRIEALGGNGNEQPYRVLIVDDDPQLARYHEALLNQAKVTTLLVEDPADVLSHLADFRPELILMDHYMPDIDGRELAAAIRQEPAYDSIPIVFLSAEDNADMQQKVMRIGGDDFLTKPIRPEHLIGSVLVRARRFRSLRATMLRDSLTGLLNHTAIKEQTSIALSRMRRHGHQMAFAMIDIDRFKQVNDTYGHPVGDQVLRSLAHLLKQRLRNTDIIGRYGGEEFAVAMPETPLDRAVTVLNAIRESFAEIEHPSAQGPFKVTFSCGLAGYPEVDSVDSLNETADTRLYAAKNAGRNQVISKD